jgi:hypothetical protein
MPCSFSGVFYVTSKVDNTLKCIVNDELGFPTPLDITYWYPAKDAGKPFAALAESFHAKTAYYIKGDLIIMKDNTFYVPPTCH